MACTSRTPAARESRRSSGGATRGGEAPPAGPPTAATSYDAFVLPLEGARALVPVATTEAAEFPLGFSGDGRWLLYESDASGRNEVYLASFPDLRRRVQVSLAGGAAASWSGPREFWYRLPDGTWVAVTLEEREGMPCSCPRRACCSATRSSSGWSPRPTATGSSRCASAPQRPCPRSCS